MLFNNILILDKLILSNNSLRFNNLSNILDIIKDLGYLAIIRRSFKALPLKNLDNLTKEVSYPPKPLILSIFKITLAI